MVIPDVVPNWIGGRETLADDKRTLPKADPATGKPLLELARSGVRDVDAALRAAVAAQPVWAQTTPVRRGEVLRAIAQLMSAREREIAHVVARETGKSLKDALGETRGAIEMGYFVAGEGRRLYGRTTTSGAPNKSAMTIRAPVGVAALIVSGNTPIANVAWKAFPALICGNAAILKASEDTPATAWFFAKLAHEAGLPPGLLNVVQGLGEEAGQALVDHPEVDLVSFTGSCEVGRLIQQRAGARLARVCLELGGKNPFVVCDDADIERAVGWAILSAFSNAGQRCASGSRIIVFDEVYERFRDALVAKARSLKVGPADDDDFGPVITKEAIDRMVATVAQAKASGARVLTGGHRLEDPGHAGGFYFAPTILEGAAPDAPISREEVFGPITCLYRVRDFEEALRVANDSPFGLTASIHTRSVDRAMRFVERVRAGVAVVNGGTFGSEPHLPFGGLGSSGTGWREAGTEALDVYSEWKTVYINHDPSAV